MKAKTRKIVVSGAGFVWSVVELEWDVISIRVWVEGNKRIPLFSVTRRLDNPRGKFSDVVQGKITPKLLNMVPVTPKEVAELITEFVLQYDVEAEFNNTTKLAISEGGGVNS